MGNKLLTIAIPTHNRVKSLHLLLRCLQKELRGLQDRVQVMVSDNASTDETPALLATLQTDWPALIVHRNAKNVGGDANFCAIVDRLDSRYFWIFGDDDLPKTGVIAKIAALLQEESPALVYLQSEWLTPLTGPDQGEPVGALRCDWLDRLAFAKKVHIWFTFISGMIIDRQQLLQSLEGESTRRFMGSSLVQLGWVFPVLRSGTRFAFIHDRCVLATKDNSGGFPLLTVFGANFPRISRIALGGQPALVDAVVTGHLRHHLPGRIWASRNSSDNRFSVEDPWPAMRDELGSRTLFWTLIFPMGRFPKLLAIPLYQTWRVLNRLSVEADRLSLRLRHSRGTRKQASVNQ